MSLKNKTSFVLSVLLSGVLLIHCGRQDKIAELPEEVKDYIEKIEYGKLGSEKPAVTYEPVSAHLTKVSLSWIISDTIRQDDWQVNIIPKFKPDFHWAPHLTPTDNHIIHQHVFRAPALIMTSSQKLITIIPDLDIMGGSSPVGWYMDIHAPENKLTLGLSKARVNEHVLFERDEGAVYPPGELRFGFYIMVSDDKDDLFNPWRKVLAFFWDRWGSKLYASGQPLKTKNMDPYIDHTYKWAFTSWRKSVWQEFQMNEKKVGAPVFIVNVTQSPNYPEPVNEREFRSVWNQAWFSSLRSAQGLYRYGRRKNNKEFIQYANMTKELALSFPQKNGFFPGVIATEMEKVEIDGKKYNRSKGWNTFFFGNSNRNPYTWNAREAPLHILDMSFTAHLMLTWYEQLDKDERLLEYATRYANSLITLQDENGYFPGWLDSETLKPKEHLNQSPESSMSVTFLLKLHSLRGNDEYLQPALKTMDAIIRDIIPVGRWEDFETYWSCSSYGADHLVGKKVERNNMFKQNTLSMFWTAGALLQCYHVTGEEKYLAYGKRTLDELLMAQATWQPPYIYVNALGGFGVMNADGEWNDSRQSLFAPLILQYARELNSQEYLQRGLAALRSSFIMLYCPENQKTKEQWERKWPFFGEEDYGFMMENYGHGGVTGPDGVGIGEFTIYDWGNGAAAEAYNRMVDEFGKDFLLNN